jgi:drug/metabolite transporter (DMT)-like permease
VLALGIAAAVGASLLYNTSIALQALEAREVPGEHGLRPSLLGRLLRNRRWLGATAVGLLGWPFEIAALLLAPLTVVQPCLASGLLLLLWLGATRLGERPGRRELAAVAAIVVGIGGVAWAAPDRATDHAGAAAIALALVLIASPP